MDIFQQSLEFHEKYGGKLSVQVKVPLENRGDMALAYTPGVAEPCRSILSDPNNLYRYTMKGNTVAVITDGSAVLGLGDIGAAASLPVMEGKCALLKKFANVDAFPLCIDTRDTDQFIDIVKRIVTPFGGINLEDIAAPRCFEIERRLQEALDIPVFHDDQHGTSTVVLAALINSFRVVGKNIKKSRIVIVGAGAAGVACARLLLSYGATDIILCDRNGILYEGRPDLLGSIESTYGSSIKAEMARVTNPRSVQGTLADALQGADALVGVSGPNLVSGEMVKSMAERAIVIAMANPVPEIMPSEAHAAGAAVVGTGRSDFPNQINNVLVFPGIFRGALDARAKNITQQMCLAAAQALASHVQSPTADRIIPDIFDEAAMRLVAKAVMEPAA